MTPAPDLRRRLGGRWAIAWPVILPLAAALAFVQPFTDADASASAGNLLGWVLAGVAGSAALCGVLAVADVTAFRNRGVRPVPVWSVVALGAVAGLARAAALLGAAMAIGLDIGGATGVRVLASVLLGALLAPAAAALAFTIDQYRRRRQALTERLIALRAAEVARRGLADTMTDSLYGEVFAATHEVRGHLDGGHGELDPRMSRELAEDFRHTVVTSLRPLSHRLYAVRDRALPQVSALAAMRAALREHRLYPLAAASVYTVLAALIIFARSGDPAEAILWAAVTGAGLGAALAGVMALVRARPRLRPHTLALAVIAAACSSAAGALLVGATLGSAPPHRILGAAFWAAVVVLVCAAVGAGMAGEREAAETLEHEVDARTVEAVAIDRELVRVSRRLAQFVHGTLQSHLLATAYALEKADMAQGGATEVLRRASSAFEAEAAMPPVRATLSDEIGRRASLWEGFMEVDIQLPRPLDDMPPAVIADAGRVVEEALSNAHKHGDARAVAVRAERADGLTLRICVTDDGTGPAGARPGMGSAWLDFVAPDGWSLTPGPDDDGARLTVLLPCPMPVA